MEMVKKSKKVDFWFAFRRFGFFSLEAPSEDVGGCSGGGRGVDLAALWGLVEKKSKWEVIFAFLVMCGVSVAHKSS
jgi:hypothetical protein